jgi:putative hydrolase of the HAD superfamily
MPQNGRIPIDAVVFDYGEVIAGSDAEDWASMVAISNVADHSFFDSYWRYRLDYDRGWTPQEYWSKVAHDAGTEFSEEQLRELLQADAKHWMHIRQPVVDWILRLKQAGKKLGLISNMPSGFAPFFRRELSWLEQFECLILSCDLRVVKPDPEIYLAALRKLNVAPERALFLDDKDYNIAGAHAVGMQGIVFDSLEGIQPRLAQYDLPL